MENRYLPARILWYLVRTGHKRLNWNHFKMEKLYLTGPQVTVSNDCLVIDNHISKKEGRRHWRLIVKALVKEAEELYPEFRDRVIIFDDEKEIRSF